MHCSSSDLLVSMTCPTQLGCWHPMAFPAGKPAHSQSLLPDMDFLLSQLPPTQLSLSLGHLVQHCLVPTMTRGWLASPSFQSSIAVRVSQTLALLISSNCKVGNAPLSPHG